MLLQGQTRESEKVKEEAEHPDDGEMRKVRPDATEELIKNDATANFTSC